MQNVDEQGTRDRDVESKVLELFRRACAEEGIETSISPDRKLAELAIDSMRLVEIVYEIEKFYGVEIREDLLGNIDSAKELIEVVQTTVSTSRGL